MKIDMQELDSQLRSKLSSGYISSSILLGRSRFIDESSRSTAAYTDPSYFPFYYQLGRLVPAKSLMEIGFRLGIPSACFLQGCPDVTDYFGFRERQDDDFYSPRLATGNVKDHFRGNFNSHVGLITDATFLDNLRTCRWDVVLIDEETSYDKHLAYLDLVWSVVASGGLIVVDYLNRHEHSRKAFEDFSSARNRESLFLPTRYGVGIIQR